MPDTPPIDLDAVSDALIDLERTTARIVATIRRSGVPSLRTLGALTEIHTRIARACHLEDD